MVCKCLVTKNAYCPIYLYDELGDWLGDDLEHLGGFLPWPKLEAVDQQLRQTDYDAARQLQRQQNQHRQPVETVVDRCPGKCTAVGHSHHLLSKVSHQRDQLLTVIAC